jgi:hypothetical protein
MRSGTVNKSRTPPAAAPPVPSAFAARKNMWGPPPRRDSPASGDADDAAAQTATPQPPIPARRFVATSEPELEGEGE